MHKCLILTILLLLATPAISQTCDASDCPWVASGYAYYCYDFGRMEGEALVFDSYACFTCVNYTDCCGNMAQTCSQPEITCLTGDPCLAHIWWYGY